MFYMCNPTQDLLRTQWTKISYSFFAMENLGSKTVTRRESMIHHKPKNLWVPSAAKQDYEDFVGVEVLANKFQMKMKI